MLPEPLRTESGHRRYDKESERRLRIIMRGRELGFTLEDLQNLLGLVDKHAVSCGEVEKTAQNHLQSIREKIRDLKRMERALGQTVQLCSGADVPECPIIETLFGDTRKKRTR